MLTLKLPHDKQPYPMRVGDSGVATFKTDVTTKGWISVAPRPPGVDHKRHAWLSTDEAGEDKVPKSDQWTKMVSIKIGTGSGPNLPPGTYYLHFDFARRDGGGLYGTAGEDGLSVIEIDLKAKP